MVETWVPLLGGIVLLIAGGDLLVRGAVRVASRLGVSPLVIGLTLVGFGTSTPELVTSVQAALMDAPGIAFGNIVGLNIANILLIGGASAMLFPITVSASALRHDGAAMILVATCFAVLAALMPMERWLGAAFLLGLVVYITIAFQLGRQAQPASDLVTELREQTAGQGAILGALAVSLAGLALVVLGGTFLVDGAVKLAQSFGISETVIGLMIVAVGTSLPELVTSVLAALRRQSEVAFGNIIGSNIYNILGIGGATALIAPGSVPAEIARFDNIVMVLVSLAFIALAWIGKRITRPEGLILLLGYGAYVYAIWP